MNFRQFAVEWIGRTAMKYPTIMWDLAEVFGNYETNVEYLETVIQQLQKLLAAWKEYRNIKIS